MADEQFGLVDQKREMEKKVHQALLDFERSTGLAVLSIVVHRLDEGRVLPITSEAVTTKVELIA